MGVADLIRTHTSDWQAATQHAFLDAVREGALPDGAFQTWLVQDYLFVGDLLTYQSRLLARAPRRAQAVLISGLAALEAELTWFEAHAETRRWRLDADREPATAQYRSTMVGLEDAAPIVGLAALWAIERAYLDSWKSAAPGDSAYADFVEHWTAPAFEEYVRGLERAADDAILGGGDAGVETAFLRIARREREFWDMALGGRQA